MKLLTSPKSVYLLNAGIDVLHDQSTEWLNEIAFWRDETSFYYALVIEKTLMSVPIDSKYLIENIEKDLINITGGELDDLQKNVENHEALLSELLDRKDDDLGS